MNAFSVLDSLLLCMIDLINCFGMVVCWSLMIHDLIAWIHGIYF